MKKITLFIVFSLFITYLSFSQENLMTINKKPISNTEFKRIYLKNNNSKAITEKDIDEYLNLFINFKLKVLEAENLGYDTTRSFNEEYNKYVYQLAEPFFTDSVFEQKMLEQAYQRSKKEVRISYILVIPENGDTTIAQQRALKIYDRLQKGEDFQKVAMETSESKNKDNDKCDAWYNPVFMMPIEIEDFAFTKEIGAISKPIYSNNAYFILKITDNRVAPKKVKAEHIYIRLPQDASYNDSIVAMKLIDSVSNSLKSGMLFEDAAKEYSQDLGSASKGGDLGWFSSGRMFRDFETATYSIKNINDIIGPIRSPAGYHFIKLTDRKMLGTFDEEKEELLNSINKSPRSEILKQSVIDNLKKEYSYSQKSLLSDFSNAIDTSIFIAKWSPEKFKNDNRVIATIANKNLTFEDFANYLAKNQLNIYKNKFDQNIEQKYNDFISQELKNYELTQLPNKNLYFKNLSQEYHDGLLLFNITNDLVWEKAIRDTLGLKNYFKENRNNYTQKLNLTIYSYQDEQSMNATIKALKNKEKKKLSDSAIVNIVNNKKGNIKIVESGIYSKGDNSEVDFVINMMDKHLIDNNKNIVVDDKQQEIIYIKDNLYTIKGIVTADYQNILEQNWILQLRKKYKVEINQDVYNKTKKELLNK